MAGTPDETYEQRIDRLRITAITASVYFVHLMPLAMIAIKWICMNYGMKCPDFDPLMAFCFTSIGGILLMGFPSNQPNWLQTLLTKKRDQPEVLKVEEKISTTGK